MTFSQLLFFGNLAPKVKRITKFTLVAAGALIGLLLALRGLERVNQKGHSKASLSIGKTETHNNVTTTSGTSGSQNAAFNCRRVLFVVENPHPLCRRTADLLAERLKEYPAIEQLTEVMAPDAGDDSKTNSLTDGFLAPDLFVRLNLRDVSETGIASRTMKAVVTCSLGNGPWHSAVFSQSETTPPIINLESTSIADNESRFTGVRIDRYGETAKSIADEFAKTITYQLGSLAAKYPVSIDWPAYLCGPYEPVADFAFLNALGAQRAYSYYGPFVHNETFWKFQTGSNPVPQLQQIAEQMKRDQWQVVSEGLTNTLDYRISFIKSETTLEIYRPDDSRREDLELSGRAGPTMEFVAHYQKSFSHHEVEAAMDKLLAEKFAMTKLLPFENSFSAAQRDRFFQLLEQTPSPSPQGSLLLAQNYFWRNDTNRAVKMLLRAKALEATLTDASDLDSNIQEQAKKISPHKKLELTIDSYREAGFIEITNAPRHIETEHQFGEPFCFVVPGQPALRTLCLKIEAPKQGMCSYEAIETAEGSRSFSRSSFGSKAQWTQTFSLNGLNLNFAVPRATVGKALKLVLDVKNPDVTRAGR